MPDAEKRRSAELTEAILLKRGREALSRDDAAGHARPLPAWLQEQVEAEDRRVKKEKLDAERARKEEAKRPRRRSRGWSVRRRMRRSGRRSERNR